MLNQIIIASSNPGKHKELLEKLTALNVKALTINQFAEQNKIVPPGEIAETGSTYQENAKIKADAIFQWAKHPALGDDTGLEIDHLNGAPGLYTARYGGKNLDSLQRMQLVLDQMQGSQNRSARFKCCLVLKLKDNQYLTSVGTLEGQIAEKISDIQGGFGYDRIFYIPELKATLAELKAQGLNVKTHRSLAVENLLDLLSKQN